MTNPSSNQTPPEPADARVRDNVFDSDGEIIMDLVTEVPLPSEEMLRVGKMALDDYYEGTKDADELGAFGHVYRAMRAVENRAAQQAHGVLPPSEGMKMLFGALPLAASPSPALPVQGKKLASITPPSEEQLGRMCDGLSWEVLKAVYTIEAHCTVLTDSQTRQEASDLANCIKHNLIELCAALRAAKPVSDDAMQVLKTALEKIKAEDREEYTFEFGPYARIADAALSRLQQQGGEK